MGEAEFIGMLVIALGALIGIMTPVIRLNSSITMLNEALKNIKENDLVRDTRINEHGKKLDEHELKLTEHEMRLNNLDELRIKEGEKYAN